MIILGIDPGLSGALCLLKAILLPYDTYGCRIIDCIDIPVIGEKAKRRVDAYQVVAFLEKEPPDVAFIERAQAFPDQGASGSFHYGRAVGALEACAMGFGTPLEIIDPRAWKKAQGLVGRGKEDSRQKARMLFPDAPFFDRKKDHNRAEAALIADYGRQLKNG